jgi:hypothetical protein
MSSSDIFSLCSDGGGGNRSESVQRHACLTHSAICGSCFFKWNAAGQRVSPFGHNPIGSRAKIINLLTWRFWHMLCAILRSSVTKITGGSVYE